VQRMYGNHRGSLTGFLGKFRSWFRTRFLITGMSTPGGCICITVTRSQSVEGRTTNPMEEQDAENATVGVKAGSKIV
jgi:hypothetical protein